jgi:hypothetical protein
MNQLENLIRQGDTPVQERKPFKTWGSPWKTKTVGMRLLTAAENEEVLMESSSIPALAIGEYSSKALLARVVVTIDGVPAVSAEDLERYNKESDTKLTLVAYKHRLLGKLDPPILNAISSEYNLMVQERTEELMGIVKNSSPTPAAEPSGKSESK